MKTKDLLNDAIASGVLTVSDAQDITCDYIDNLGTDDIFSDYLDRRIAALPTTAERQRNLDMANHVATLLAETNPLAGQSHSVEAPQDVCTRATNLRTAVGPAGKYLAYVEPGDPCEWGGEGVVATIFMEPKGGIGDCRLPIEYYNGGHEIAMRVSDKLREHYIEFINPAVACVYPI